MYQMSFLSVEVPQNYPVEGCKGGGDNFHLRGPNRRSVLPPGARTRVCEATRAYTAYLVGYWKARFCLYGNAEGLWRYRC